MVVGSFVLVGSQVLVFGFGLPIAEIVFSVVQDLAGLGAVGVGLALVTWRDGGTVQELEDAAAVAGQDDLLLGPLDRGEEFGVVGFLELLTGLIKRNIPHINFLAPQERGSATKSMLNDKDRASRRFPLTIFVNWASATKFSASALTSSCSRTTSLALSGSLDFSLAISSATLRFPSRLGWTLFSVLRICFMTPLASSRAWA